MEPHQKMHHLFHNLLRRLFMIIGHDIFRDGEFRPYALTYIVWAIFGTFALGIYKTLLNYDMTVKLNVAAFIGLAFELIAKIYSVKFGKILVEVMDQFIEIFKQNAKNPSRTRQMLIQRHAFFTELVLKGGLLLYALAAGFYLIEPIYSFVFYNKLVPLFPIYFPYIDEDTTEGYIVLAGIHLVYGVLAVIATGCTDFMFIMIIVNIPVLSNILSDEVRELNETLREEDVNMAVVRGRFRNILFMHRELWDVIDVLDVAIFWICFFQMSCATFSAAIELFICLKIQFFPAIGLSIAFLGQIIFFSAVGAVVEICNGQAYDAIIDLDWFLMSHNEQMEYMFLMMNAQGAKALRVGGLAPLNMPTCVSILKTIYSYLMILYTFIE